jgi:glycosyltransferase involved in cell wall biosynthesis
VHKGLDLVLEVFRETPECQLMVCGPLDAPSEKEFVQAFHQELYETPNIQAIGWVDVGSERFKKIANSCTALIYPSCSEGQAGSVVTCLQAGVIPLVSYESGVDVDGFGAILDECSHEQIKKTIMDLVEKSNDELAELSLKAHEYAKQNHSEESYRKAFDRVISKIERGKSAQ